ncbi:MAG: hypothetical protein WA655_19595 [Candidatus Korobacteraceae bacterium]
MRSGRRALSGHGLSYDGISEVILVISATNTPVTARGSIQIRGAKVFRIVVTGTILLLLSTSPAFAQVATINTRGQQPTGPAVSITAGTGSSDGSTSKSLELKLKLPAFSNLIVGEPFDYELLITNKSDKAILLPQSLSWSNVDDGSESEQRYQELEASFAVLADDGDRGAIQGNLVLYGKETNPATMIVLKPGRSVRILGSADFAPAWDHPPAPGTGMHLVAYLAVNSARLRPRNGQSDTYRDDERQLYWAQSQSEEIMFQEAQ